MSDFDGVGSPEEYGDSALYSQWLQRTGAIESRQLSALSPYSVRRAKQLCQTRDHTAGTAAHEKCVHEESEKIYNGWGRDRQFLGLD